MGTNKIYDLITEGRGTPSSNLLESIKKSYNNGVTDEFIKPIVHVDQHGKNWKYKRRRSSYMF